MKMPSEPTPFQKFDALTRSVMNVAKGELDKRSEADKKRRLEGKRAKIR